MGISNYLRLVVNFNTNCHEDYGEGVMGEGVMGEGVVREGVVVEGVVVEGG